MGLTRRSFIKMVAAVAGQAPFPLAASAVQPACQQEQALADSGIEGRKVGPSPLLPGLFRDSRRFLFSDGTTMIVDCFCYAVIAHTLARRGFSRSIPEGMSLNTDEQKLWLLGRKTFARLYQKNSSELLSGGMPTPIRSARNHRLTTSRPSLLRRSRQPVA